MAVTLVGQQRDIKAVGTSENGKKKTVTLSGVSLDYATNGDGLDTLAAAFDGVYEDIYTFEPMKVVDTKSFSTKG